MKQNIQKALHALLALMLILTSVSIPVQANEDPAAAAEQNIALNKPTNTSGGQGERAVDGDLSTYWDGGVYPGELLVDLEGYYDVSRITVIPYYGGSRYYHYEVYVSDDGFTYDLVGRKDSDEPQTSEGETYEFASRTVKYVKVVMTYNSANPSIHINELQVFGTENTDYEPPETPAEDPNDPLNIAYGKPTRSTANSGFTQLAVDGQNSTAWSGEDYPKYVDVDLMRNYDITSINVCMPQDGTQYAYTLYGSVDGVHFTRIAETKMSTPQENGDTYTFEQPLTYRVIRVNVTGNSKGEGANSTVSEIRVYGSESDEPLVPTRESLELTSYEDWLYDHAQVDVDALKDENGHYDIKDTYDEEDVIAEVRGVVSRILGERYNDWFTFALSPSENGKDYYEISDEDGKIRIVGNEGVSLTAGLNHYLKYYCNVHVSQQTSQVNMPDTIPAVGSVIRKESPYEIRYAYNYCTLSYTMAFWGYDEWQRELDYFALNGVNLILDTTATEALWIEYLQNYGYDIDDAKAFVCGYAYKAWWLMGNLSSYGGPVSDEWVIDTVEMARVNQRKMTVLGMTPCLQGFMGALPEDFADKSAAILGEKGYDDIHAYMVEQGDWSGFTRPPILKTTYDGYDELAETFYETQEFIYGQITDYYAGDLAHEGGVIPPDLSKPEMSAYILGRMMDYDEDAVWIIQSWLSNPDPGILEGFGEYREDHILVLDLDATENPHWSDTVNWNGKEFGGTSWVYCMLDNYGGRTGMHGELENLATQIAYANANSEHMKGIGITPEGTMLNPVNYDLFWEMAWESEPMDTEEWLKDYVSRRYGSYAENSWKGWQLLLDTAYGYNNDDGTALYHTGNVNCITNMRPSFDPEIVIGDYELTYDPTVFEEAVKLILSDFDQFKGNECYVYDVVDLLRQMTANSQVAFFDRICEAYENGNLEIFEKYRDKLLNSILLLDEIAAYEEDSLYGTWIAKAENFADDPRNSKTYDDYSRDMMEINAKALVSIWSSKTLQTYAHRQYHGLEKDYNYPMWKLWLDAVEDAMNGGSYVAPSSNVDYFNIGWNIVLNDTEYPTIPAPAEGDATHRGLYAIYEELMSEYTYAQAQKDKIINENIASEGTAYAQTTLGSNEPSRINDGDAGSLWIAGSSSVPVYAGISFAQLENIYRLQLVFETRPTLGSNIMRYYIEAHNENGEWETIYTGQSYDEENQSYTITIPFDELIRADDIRITYTGNGGIYPALAEMRVYASSGIQVLDGSGLFIEDGQLKGVAEGTSVASLRDQLYSGSGTIQFTREGEELGDDAIIDTDTTVSLIDGETLLDVLDIGMASELRDDLRTLLEEAQALEADVYSTMSFAHFTSVLQTAQRVYDDEQSTPLACHDAYTDLQDAMDDLFDLRPLQAQLDALAGKDPTYYIPEKYEKAQSYHAQALQIWENRANESTSELYRAMGYAELAANYLLHDSSSNVAVYGTPYADNELSSYYGIAHLNDMEFDSCWVANSYSVFPVSGGITLDQSYAVDHLKIVFEENGYRNTQLGFYVSVLDEQGEWQRVYTGTTGAKEGYTFRIDMDGMRIEDVRVTFTSYSTDAGSPYPGVAEIEVYTQNDDTILSEQVTKAQMYLTNADAYTKASWNVFVRACDQAEFILADGSYVQGAIDDAAESLANAMDALQRKASNPAMKALQELVDNANAMESEDETLHAAINAAQALLDDPDNASVTAAVSALLNLSEAMQALNTDESTDALREDVQATIDFINENILNDVEGLRPGKVQALKDAITAAQKLLANEDAAADQLKAANKAMTKAAQELWEIVTKAELEALIEAANGYLDGDYTAESLEALQTAIEAAQTVAINDDATTSEVTDAITSLANAIASLEEITLDTSALAHEIELATEMAANIDDYVPSTVEGLADKLADAQNVLTNATSQEEIDAATETLREARLNARTKADVSALEELAAYVNSLDLSGYSQLSVQRLQAALSAANTLMDDEEASQEAINLAEYTLQKALDELTQEEAEENIVPKPVGTQSGSAVQSTDADEQETTAADVTTSASASTSSYALIFTLLAAGGILLITHKKRQR